MPILAKTLRLPMVPVGFVMRCCEWDLWCDVPAGAVAGELEGDGPVCVEEDLCVGTASGPGSAAFAETIFTAAARLFVLKILVPFLLLRRTGARGPDILTVVVIRVVRPPGVDEDDELDEAVLGLLVLLVMLPPPAASAAWAR